MKYVRDKYLADNSTAIFALTDYGEPYATCTVCLKGYGITPPSEDCVFVPTYKLGDFYEEFKEALIEEEISAIPIGYGEGVFARLKENWKEITEEAE